MSHRSLQLAAATLAVSGLLLSGCTADRAPQPGRSTAAAPAPALRLVAFDSCAALTADLRRAARDAVGPYGFPMLGNRAEAVPAGARQAVGDLASAAGGSPTQPFSGTNTHEQGVDEPDIVKTDGRRIVTITRNVLRVVDAASRKETGRLLLDVTTTSGLTLLLAGDTVLVLVPAGGFGRAADRLGAPVAAAGPELLTVSLTGKPTLVSRYRLDAGEVVDARQIGGVARVVLRSAPSITMPLLPDGTPEDKRVQANRATIDKAPVEAWLPGYEITTAGRTTAGRVGCDRVSRPAEYSGASLVTVLTLDLATPTLGDGDPVAVLADGDTVYGTGTALYVATDPRWRDDVWRDIARSSPQAPRTDIYRFDVTGKARPVYAASGSVPGRLINQYALSEWDGHLRVATTTTEPATTSSDVVEQTAPPTSSAIRVLRRDGGSLVQAGIVDGLGKGEQIYAVRYVGARGYVVTFRKTDPLYTVDLSNPAKPAVTSELKITGYSARLQSVGDGRLVGVGQEATEQGRTVGTQVSLFDVSDPRAPRRVTQQVVANGQSDAEYDPHALLWWPATNLLVVPVTTFDESATEPRSAALVLRVSPDGLTRVGSVSQPGVGRLGTQPTIRRSLMVGDTLWTLSDQGLQASDAASLKSTGWLPSA